ncbi:hypothetical protein ACU610_21655 [Geodermatophilus sp. URMC 61]|uniref:hypothetical protein n=1 Tax=Geodermatophilus sp. URMC 61 TaxID=3423411 RepID=UPI00406C0CD2
MKRWRVSRRTVVLGAGLVGLTCAAAVPGVPAPLQVLAGVALVLAAPGAAFVHATRLVEHLPRTTVWMLVPASSIALTILLMLFLQLVQVEITQVSTAAGLFVLTAGLAAAGELRRRGRDTEPDIRGLPGLPRRPPARPTALVAIAGVLMLGAVTVAWAGEQGADDRVAFSQLWLLPAAEPGEVVVGVRSDEPAAEEFRVEVSVRGQSSITHRWSIDLQPGESWERPVTVPPGASAEARLLRSGESAAYRQVDLTPAAPSPAPPREDD